MDTLVFLLLSYRLNDPEVKMPIGEGISFSLSRRLPYPTSTQSVPVFFTKSKAEINHLPPSSNKGNYTATPLYAFTD